MSDPQLHLRPADGEVRATVSLMDFFRVWGRYRVAYLVGLLVIGIGSFWYTYSYLPKFYRSEARFFLWKKFTPESLAGLAETELFVGNRNEQFMSVVQGYLAEQYLTSAELILEAAKRMVPKDEAGFGFDLAELLGIPKGDPPVVREGKIVKIMRDDVITVRQIRNSGIIEFSVELPHRKAAMRYVNHCLDILQERFTDMNFAYFETVLGTYRNKLTEEQGRRVALSGRLEKINLDFHPSIEQERQEIEEELEFQAKWLAEMKKTIAFLELATSPDPKKAASPIEIIQQGQEPFKKSRPRTILSVIMACALYTFVFMIGLVLIGFLGGRATVRDA